MRSGTAGTRSARRSRCGCRPRARGAAEATDQPGGPRKDLQRGAALLAPGVYGKARFLGHCGMSSPMPPGFGRIQRHHIEHSEKTARSSTPCPAKIAGQPVAAQRTRAATPTHRDRPPARGKLRPAQRRSDLRRCDTVSRTQQPLSQCQRPAGQARLRPPEKSWKRLRAHRTSAGRDMPAINSPVGLLIAGSKNPAHPSWQRRAQQTGFPIPEGKRRSLKKQPRYLRTGQDLPPSAAPAGQPPV